MYISKSKFINYVQCPKKFWLNVYKPELADEMDQTKFQVGTEVGVLARDLFPGGTLVDFCLDDKDKKINMINVTKSLMESGCKVIYEAAFNVNNLLVICDILVKKGNFYDIYEVKSSTGVSDVYIFDVAFQYFVLKACGIPVRNVYVVHINNQYTRSGDLDLHKLFKTVKVTNEALDLQDYIAQNVPQAFSILESDSMPVEDIGHHCDSPYECQFKGLCWSHVPEHSVFNLTRNNKDNKFALYNQGIISFEDILKSGIPLRPAQKKQIEAQLFDTKFIDKNGISEFLDTLYYPLCFFDFETFQPPVPLFDGTRPFQQIPSQFSLHLIESEGAPLQHFEFLAKEGQDPREDLIQHMIRYIPGNGCVLAYNMAFEKSVIRNLASDFPAYEESLMTIHDNILDLMSPFQKRYFYTKAMEGSHSIKYVLPAMFPDDPDLSYDNLGLVHNGGEAMSAYLSLPNLLESDRLELRQALLAYCKLDTLAMVKIWERLREVVN